MKTPSKNISKSLRGQSMGAGMEESISVTKPGGRPTMTVPGEGNVETPPGRQHERSAAKYAGPQSRFGGK